MTISKDVKTQQMESLEEAMHESVIMSDPRWYFTEEQLANSPSRKCGVNAEQELSYRQRAANLIQEMGQRLQVSQLCINTAIVYMHRFYAFHSFTLFHRNSIAAAAFFLAAKVEEQPRKLEHVIKILNICLEKNDNTRDNYAEQAQELVFNENVLLQTLGFDVAIDHPHTHVVKACQLFNIVTVSRELRQTCYFMASNSLHLTTMCLKYKPTVVAAFCIYIACKWSRWEIPDSSEGKTWYSYVDENVTTDILKKLTDEYLQILERSPSKFKSKMKAITSNGQTGINQNPSVTRDDGPSTSSLHKAHEKHHHHHRSAGSNHVNRKQPDLSSSSSSSLTSKQPQATSQTGSNYKNQPLTSSSSHMQRPRPSSGSSSSSQQPPYLGNNVSETSQKHANDERTQHRQVAQQENPTFPMLPRQIDPSRPRPNSSQANMSSSQQQQQQQSSQQHQQSHQKPSNHDQRHPQSMGAKPLPDYHQKTMKPPQPDFPNRSSTHSQQQPPLPQQHKKQPSWPPQQPGVVNQQKPPQPPQSHVQSSQSQPNLSSSSSGNSNSSNNRNMPQTLPSYNESTKQSSSSQPAASNDYWFNDNKIQDPTMKVASPPRITKSMFSPSPEHDAYDRTKLLIMQAANAKRNDSPKSDKSDRRSSTPNKRDKKPELTTTPNASQKVPQQKLLVPKLEGAPSASQLMPEQNKKRPFSSIDEGDLNRDSKSRKVEPAIKMEPLVSGAMKQPIETNPDIVKSLLKECYTANSKFDSYGMDSPLDVINPEPTAQSVPSMLASSSFPPQVKMESDLMTVKEEPQDNGYGDDHSRKKSKKERKKDKHKHKKNKKSHKSDKSDREDRKDSLKIILSNKSDSPSEGLHTGGLKIKIPIKDVNKTDLPPAGSSLPPAPLKLKLSKEKFGSGFNNSSQNLSDGGSSSSSSHKKKDKDRSKSKSSKHGNNNNNSDYKDAGYQQQQLPPQQQPMNKMNSQVPLQQQQQTSNQSSSNQSSQNPYDFGSLFNDNSFSQHGYFNQPQMPTTNSQGLEYHSFNDFFHNSSVNYSNHNASSNGGNKK